MNLRTRRLLLLIAALSLGLTAILWREYRFDMAQARERVAVGSQVVATPCGPIEYVESGSGAPLLVVHGAGGGFDQGLEFAGSLPQRGFRVIAMSRFGYLRTPLPADPSAAAQADAHACLLDALGIARAAIIGGSAGAPSAMQFAIRHAERCSALVLLVPLAYKPDAVPASAPSLTPAGEKVLTAIVGSDFSFWLMARIARETVIRLVLGTPPELVRAAGPDEQARIERIIAHIQPIHQRAQGLLNDGRIGATLPRYELERIQAPTLVMSVVDDLYGTFAGAIYTASQIPGAKFLGYEDGGHTWVGHEHDVMAKIAAFLSSSPTRGHAPAEDSVVMPIERPWI